jgi:hypothetical protein
MTSRSKANEKDLVITIGFILVVLGNVFAQTPSMLREKYGPADEKGRYTVRPSIGLQASYDSYGAPLSMTVKPLNDGFQSNPNKSQLMLTMSASVALEILDEIVPANQRGKRTQSLSYENGCFSRETNEYEKVTTKLSNRCEQQGGGTYSVQVLWKKPKK